MLRILSPIESISKTYRINCCLLPLSSQISYDKEHNTMKIAMNRKGGCILVLVVTLMLACKEDYNAPFEGKGTIKIRIATEKPKTKSGRTASAHEVDFSGFNVAIKAKNTEKVVESWDNYSEVPESIVMEPGEYTVEIFSDQVDYPKFNAPFYYGSSKSFKAIAGEDQVIEINLSLNAVEMSIAMSDKAKTFYKEIEVRISETTSGKSLVFTKNDESNKAYFNPGELSVVVKGKITGNDGKDIVIEKVDVIKASVNESYVIRIDGDNPFGNGSLNVTVVNTTQKDIEITLGLDNTPPVAAFTTSTGNKYLNKGTAITFTDASLDSDGVLASWSWDFGNGDTSDQQNPEYTYNDTGSYSVSLTVKDNLGAIHTKTMEVEVVGINWALDVGQGFIKGIKAARADDGKLYIGGSDGKFRSVNPDGTVNWVTELTTGSGNQEIYDGSGAMTDSGDIIVTSQNGNVYSLALTNGEINWAFTPNNGEGFRSGAAIGTDGTIYVNGRNEKFYALNPNGTLKWEYAHAGGGDSNPAIASDGTIVFGSDDKHVYAFDPVQGGTPAPKWSFATGNKANGSPSIANGVVYIGSEDNKLYAIRLSNGEKIWESKAYADNTVSTPTIDKEGKVYFGIKEKAFYALNASDGTESWSKTDFSDDFIFSSATLDANGLLYIANDNGMLYAFDTTNGTLAWSIKLGKTMFSSVTLGADGNIYIGTGSAGGGKPSFFYSLYAASAGHVDSPWPTKRGDDKNTGREQ